MISIVLTTYKREPKMIRRAIDSVLTQTFTDWELIIVDDSPNDFALRDDVRDMVKEIHDERISYVRHEKNSGVSAARNTGIKLSRGEFITFLDDDDEYLPEKLELQLKAFTPDIGFVYCRNFYVDDSTGKIKDVPKIGHDGKIFYALLRENIVGTPGFVMVRTECLKNVGGFVVPVPPEEIFEDWDLWITLAKKYNAGFVDVPLVKYHDNHGEHNYITSHIVKGQEYFYRKYKNYLRKDKYLNCKRLSALSRVHRKAGNFKMAFLYWLRALPLQPFRMWTHIKEFLKGEKFS